MFSDTSETKRACRVFDKDKSDKLDKLDKAHQAKGRKQFDEEE